MKIYPKHYCENIITITPEFLKENDIRALSYTKKGKNGECYP